MGQSCWQGFWMRNRVVSSVRASPPAYEEANSRRFEWYCRPLLASVRTACEVASIRTLPPPPGRGTGRRRRPSPNAARGMCARACVRARRGTGLFAGGGGGGGGEEDQDGVDGDGGEALVHGVEPA